MSFSVPESLPRRLTASAPVSGPCGPRPRVTDLKWGFKHGSRDNFWKGRRQTHFKWSGLTVGRRGYYDLVMSPARSKAISTGFTLVEILIVISIVTLLIAMLLPAVKRARTIARYTVCATQQRQITMALLQYAIENKEAFPWGWWATPTTIGAGFDIIEKIQAKDLVVGDALVPGSTALQTPDIALVLMQCPSWQRFSRYDRVFANDGSYTGWGGRFYGPWVHTTYVYVGGNGKGLGGATGGGWWNGWVTYDGATLERYEDPYRPGPVPTTAHRLRHGDVALLTDRMWITDLENMNHPFRYNDIGGPPAAVNHRTPLNETEGGNVSFVDGHVELRYVRHIRERVSVYGPYMPFVCY